MAVVDAQAISRSATTSFQAMSGPQRLTLGLAFAATVIGLFFVSRAASTPAMALLYGNLDATDASEIVDYLESSGIPYEVTDGGRAIRVPAGDVNATRIAVSGQGLTGGSEGWAVLDDQGITTSAFDQRVGYQRAMEGELAKTISAIDGVSRANVHLAIPEHDLVLDESQRASASVLVVRSGSGSLGPTQVDAIVNLVASSVEGLTADQVSVADETGRVLAAPGEGAAVVGLDGDRRLRAKRDFEALLEGDLEALLGAVVGPGLAVVNVSADLDFDSVSTVTETFQPAQTPDGDQMLVSETTRAELYRGEDELGDDEGPLAIEEPEPADPEDPEADADGEDGVANGDGVVYSLDERDAVFAVDKVITNAENSGGDLKSLSVAVLLDEAAVDEARLAEIEDLVAAAAGIDVDRGDTLAVTLAPMNETFRAGVEAMAAEAEAEAGGGLDLIGLIRTIATALVALVVVVFGLRMVTKGPETETVGSVDLQDMAELPSGSRAELPAAEIDLTPEHLEELIANQTDDVAGVLRSWLHESEGEVR